jgi:hypothetical protein
LIEPTFDEQLLLRRETGPGPGGHGAAFEDRGAQSLETGAGAFTGGVIREVVVFLVVLLGFRGVAAVTGNAAAIEDDPDLLVVRRSGGRLGVDGIEGGVATATGGDENRDAENHGEGSKS